MDLLSLASVLAGCAVAGACIFLTYCLMAHD